MINFDDITKENIKDHYPNWSQKILIINTNINNWRACIWKNEFSI